MKTQWRSMRISSDRPISTAPPPISRFAQVGFISPTARYVEHPWRAEQGVAANAHGLPISLFNAPFFVIPNAFALDIPSQPPETVHPQRGSLQVGGTGGELDLANPIRDGDQYRKPIDRVSGEARASGAALVRTGQPNRAPLRARSDQCTHVAVLHVVAPVADVPAPVGPHAAPGVVPEIDRDVDEAEAVVVERLFKRRGQGGRIEPS